MFSSASADCFQAIDYNVDQVRLFLSCLSVFSMSLNFMSLNFRFAIASDLHIGLPHTIWNHPNRFHLIEVSIPAFEQTLRHVSQLDIDFLLLPGDLVQHGERENHAWLCDRLTRLPFPVYVIPGNHDFVTPQGDDIRIAPTDFSQLYQKFGYEASKGLDYSVSPLPGLRLIGLNSNQFDKAGQPVGRLTQQQFVWLRQELTSIRQSSASDQVFIMVHHNVIEHLPQQSKHPLGYKYMLRNAGRLRSLLKEFGVQLVFTGHLHVQDVVRDEDLYEVTTGSLVSYPHPYRLLQFRAEAGQVQLSYESFRIADVAGFPDLQGYSRQWMGDRSQAFMESLLAGPPTHVPPAEAAALAPSLREFWAGIAEGDRRFDFPQLPASVRAYFESFGAMEGAIDNGGCLQWVTQRSARLEPTPTRV